MHIQKHELITLFESLGCKTASHWNDITLAEKATNLHQLFHEETAVPESQRELFERLLAFGRKGDEPLAIISDRTPENRGKKNVNLWGARLGSKIARLDAFFLAGRVGTVSEIAAELQIPYLTVTNHLQKRKAAGLVKNTNGIWRPTTLRERKQFLQLTTPR